MNRSASDSHLSRIEPIPPSEVEGWSVFGAFSSAGGAFRNATSATVGALGEATSMTVGAMKSATSSSVDAVKKATTSTVGAVKTATTSTVGAVSSAAGYAGSAVKTATTSTVGAVGKATTHTMGAVTHVVGYAERGTSAAKDKVTKALRIEQPRTVLQEEYWCSWCFQHCQFSVKETNLFSRNLYKCRNCFNFCARCTRCKPGLARVQPDGSADLSCMVCDGTISAWGTDSDVGSNGRLYSEGNCSWCFKPSRHSLQHFSRLSRNTYKCEGCGNATVACRKCRTSFARCNPGYADELCAKCDRSITDWNSEVAIAAVTVEGWCSWCIEFCKHTRQQTNCIRRHVFQCNNCQSRTLNCVVCKLGFVRGGDGWDDSLCVSCAFNVKDGWEVAAERRKLMFESRDIEFVKYELRRNSEFKQKAWKEGVLRPFQLLVAMPAIFRNRVANQLGWSTITQSCFGDSHEEAWQILNSHRTGIQARANHSYERLNVLARNCDWYYILYRVFKEAFQGEELPAKASSKAALEACRAQSDRLILDVEEQFYVNLAAMSYKAMSAEERTQLDKLMTSEQFLTTRKAVVKHTGINRADVTKYTLQQVKSNLGINSLFFPLLALRTVGSLIPAAASATGTMAAKAMLLATPLSLLSLYGTITGGIQLAVGSSEGRLFIPVSIILNQRLLLAAEGLNIDDFCTLELMLPGDPALIRPESADHEDACEGPESEHPDDASDADPQSTPCPDMGAFSDDLSPLDLERNGCRRTSV